MLRMLVYFGNKPAVCARLYVENSTVSTTLSRIRAKYRAAGRPADNQITLATRAYQDGLITLEEADAAEPPATWVASAPRPPARPRPRWAALGSAARRERRRRGAATLTGRPPKRANPAPWQVPGPLWSDSPGV